MSRFFPLRARQLLRCLLVAALAAFGLHACAQDSDEPVPFETREQRATPPAEPAAAPTAAAADVRVTARARQRIQGWGASVVASLPIDPLVVPSGMSTAELRGLDRLVFRTAGINIVRVFGPGYGPPSPAEPWAPSEARFAFMRRVRPYGVKFMFTGGDAPPELKDGGSLREGAESAYAEYLADLMVAARDQAKAPFSYIALANEPDNENALLQLSPEQSVRVQDALVRLLRERGLGTQLVLADTAGWANSVRYADPALENPALRRASAAIAAHAYFGTDGDRRALADLARSASVPVWQTEWGAGCPTCRDENSMADAIPWSMQIAAALTHAETTAWFAFRAIADSGHGPEDALLVRTRGSRRAFYASKRFHVFRQYSSAGPRGARRLVVKVPHGLRGVAFDYRGTTRLVLTNPAPEARRVGVSLGDRPGTLTFRRTSADENFARLRRLRYVGRPIRMDLPPASVTTIWLARTPQQRAGSL